MIERIIKSIILAPVGIVAGGIGGIFAIFVLPAFTGYVFGVWDHPPHLGGDWSRVAGGLGAACGVAIAFCRIWCRP